MCFYDSFEYLLHISKSIQLSGSSHVSCISLADIVIFMTSFVITSKITNSQHFSLKDAVNTPQAVLLVVFLKVKFCITLNSDVTQVYTIKHARIFINTNYEYHS